METSEHSPPEIPAAPVYSIAWEMGAQTLLNCYTTITPNLHRCTTMAMVTDRAT